MTLGSTSLIHSKLDYCNSLLLNFHSAQTKRLQFVQNTAVRAVTKTSKFHHISPIPKSLHWLKINERIQYKVLSLIKLFTLVILHIFILFLVLNVIVLHARLLWSHLIVLLIILVSKSQIGLFIILLLHCGTVFLLTYVIFHLILLLLNLILIHLYFLFLLLSFLKN